MHGQVLSQRHTAVSTSTALEHACSGHAVTSAGRRPSHPHPPTSTAAASIRDSAWPGDQIAGNKNLQTYLGAYMSAPPSSRWSSSSTVIRSTPDKPAGVLWLRETHDGRLILGPGGGPEVVWQSDKKTYSSRGSEWQVQNTGMG